VWDESQKFNPERFIVDNKAGKHKNYFPFGVGPRLCIGNNFALAEMSFFLHSFFKQLVSPATAQVPGMKPLIALRPDKVILNVQKEKYVSMI
jgi:cytochrome P450